MSQDKEMPPKLVEDSDWLVAPWGQPGVCVIGRVDEVNGRGAEAVPEFTATRYELLVLLKHWAETGIHMGYRQFLFEYSGSSDSRLAAFSWRRVDRIAAALADDEAVRAALDEVHDAYGKKSDVLAWKVYTGKATEQEKRQLCQEHEQFYLELDKRDLELAKRDLELEKRNADSPP